MTTEPKPVLTVPLARMLHALSMDESDYMTRIVLRSAANVIETLVVERKELLAARDNAPVHVPAPEPRATPEFRIVATALAHAIDRSTAEIKALGAAVDAVRAQLEMFTNQGEKR